MPIKVPFKPIQRPPEPPKEPVEPIDIPGVSGALETGVKAQVCKLIDWAIDQLLKIKARLRQPPKLDLPEIQEEDTK